MEYILCKTALGILTIVGRGNQILRLLFETAPPPAEAVESAAPVLRQATEQLEAYLDGKRRNFSLPLAPQGTPFQKEVWQALSQIPYGETRTYGEIAAQLGRPKACRAVGAANHVNPLPIFIPCHRVVGASGGLTGYAGGLQMKQQLLLLERQYSRDA